jgi:hypothetical protein
VRQEQDLRNLQNVVLRKVLVFGPKRDEVKDNGGDCVPIIFMILLFTK